MTFNLALSNAISGMNVATTSIQVRSNNIANALNENYARRDVDLASSPLGGVRVVSISRDTNAFLQRDRLSADAQSAEAGVRSQALDSINRVFGEPGDDQGLFATLSRFEVALDDLATAPESASYQQAAVTRAQDLSATFNRIGDAVTDIRTDADRDIAATVKEVNTALEALASLNKTAHRDIANGLSDAVEQREALVNTIGDALDIRVIDEGRGQIRILTAEGVTLLNASGAKPLEFTAGGVVSPEKTLAGGQLSGLSVNGVTLTPDGGAQAIKTGRLAGLFAVRDDIGVDFGNRIDALAEDLVSRFSDPAVDPTIPVGGEGLFLSNGTGAGAAARISVNSVVDPKQGGELWRIRDGVGAVTPGPSADAGVTTGLQAAIDEARVLTTTTDSPSALTLVETTAAFSSVIGTEKIAVDSIAAAKAATAQGLRDEELAATGVNTDQELQSLLLIEQAYAANARVVQVVSDMMARLLEI
ncbi:MAG: flagellar hook-associated protein FlgK [Pseudomonadota bacterium]